MTEAKMEFKDLQLTCVDCEGVFLFTAGEARYFLSKELSIPKRCKPCRNARRSRIVPDEEMIENANRRQPV